MPHDFYAGERVQLIDSDLVRREYRGQLGTVVHDYIDVDDKDEILVIYDFKGLGFETWSQVDTLIRINEDVGASFDTTNIDAFIEEV